jgi:hypothetical protein
VLRPKATRPDALHAISVIQEVGYELTSIAPADFGAQTVGFYASGCSRV